MTRRQTPMRHALEPQRAEPAIVIVGADKSDPDVVDRLARLLLRMLDARPTPGVP